MLNLFLHTLIFRMKIFHPKIFSTRRNDTFGILVGKMGVSVMAPIHSRVFSESCASSMVFQTFKAFNSFDAPFSSILKKYISYATIHYSLVAISAVFAKLKCFQVCTWTWSLVMHSGNVSKH